MATHDVRSPRSQEVSVGSNIAQRVCKVKTRVGSDIGVEKQDNLFFTIF